MASYVWVINQGEVSIEKMKYQYVDVSKIRLSLRLKKRIPILLSHKKEIYRILYVSLYSFGLLQHDTTL